MSDPAVLDDLSDLDAYYAGVSDHFNEKADYANLLTVFLQKLEQLEYNFFASEAGPDRRAWPELADSTIQKKGHDTILVDTGRLKSSLVGTTGDSIREVSSGEQAFWHFARFGTGVPYSIYHFNEVPDSQYRPHVGVGDKEIDAIQLDVAERTLEIVQEV